MSHGNRRVRLQKRFSHLCGERALVTLPKIGDRLMVLIGLVLGWPILNPFKGGGNTSCRDGLFEGSFERELAAKESTPSKEYEQGGDEPLDCHQLSFRLWDKSQKSRWAVFCSLPREGVSVTTIEALKDYPVTLEIPVAWGEMDSLGHVNNVMYFRYFESVRIEYFNRLQFMELMDSTGVGPILASTSCRFKRPVVFPDTLVGGIAATDLQEDRFTTRYRLVSKAQGGVVAEGEGLIVTYDYRANQKAPIPDVIRARILELGLAS